jgi:hypothetical protein
MKDFNGRGERATGGKAVNQFQRLPDWQAIWQHCVGIGVRLLVVESDDPGDVAEFCRESFLSANALLKG